MILTRELLRQLQAMKPALIGAARESLEPGSGFKKLGLLDELKEAFDRSEPLLRELDVRLAAEAPEAADSEAT